MRLAKATKFHRKSGEALKALEKGRLQPMYAKVREHGAPVQGERLGGKPEKLRRKSQPTPRNRADG